MVADTAFLLAKKTPASDPNIDVTDSLGNEKEDLKENVKDNKIGYKNIYTIHIDQVTLFKAVSSLVRYIKEMITRLKAEKGSFNMVHDELLKTQNSTGSNRADNACKRR